MIWIILVIFVVALLLVHVLVEWLENNGRLEKVASSKKFLAALVFTAALGGAADKLHLLDILRATEPRQPPNLYRPPSGQNFDPNHCIENPSAPDC
jgi:hypothetical protein